MEKEFRLALVRWLLIVLTALISSCGNQNDDASDSSAESAAVLSVDEVVRNFKADTTVHTVQGVVRTATADEHLLTLIDVEEYKLCGLSDCCLYMPVQWQGEMPKIEEIVDVRGFITSTDSGMVFTAKDLRVVEITDSL
jgi:hypothetical protein